MTGSPNLSPDLDVSRETRARLQILHDLVLKWTPHINLVGRRDVAHLWTRHIADSAQLWPLRPARARHWADLGAGAGFPGLVIAAFAAEQAPELLVTLVESDLRKAAFLGEAARAMGLAVNIEPSRIEALAPLHADVLSARALAPLDRLLDHAEIHRARHGRALFPKGAAVHKEIEAAAARWRFTHVLHPSATDPAAAIVEIGEIARAC